MEPSELVEHVAASLSAGDFDLIVPAVMGFGVALVIDEDGASSIPVLHIANDDGNVIGIYCPGSALVRIANSILECAANKDFAVEEEG